MGFFADEAQHNNGFGRQDNGLVPIARKALNRFAPRSHALVVPNTSVDVRRCPHISNGLCRTTTSQENSQKNSLHPKQSRQRRATTRTTSATQPSATKERVPARRGAFAGNCELLYVLQKTVVGNRGRSSSRARQHHRISSVRLHRHPVVPTALRPQAIGTRWQFRNPAGNDCSWVNEHIGG